MSFPGTDLSIKCKDCPLDFVFTAGEQQWYTEHNLTEAPKRCRACRELKKRGQQAQVSGRPAPQTQAQRPPMIAESKEYQPPQKHDDNKRRGRDGRRRRRDDDYEW